MEERLLKLLDAEQLSSSKFADIISVQRSSVSHILSGRNKPSFDFLQKTLKAFPHLSSDWLILGDGKMYKGEIIDRAGSLFDQPVKSLSEALKPEAETPALTPQDEELDEMSTAQPEISTSEEVNPKGKVIEVDVDAKKIARVIVLYADNSFDSYDEA